MDRVAQQQKTKKDQIIRETVNFLAVTEKKACNFFTLICHLWRLNQVNLYLKFKSECLIFCFLLSVPTYRSQLTIALTVRSWSGLSKVPSSSETVRTVRFTSHASSSDAATLTSKWAISGGVKTFVFVIRQSMPLHIRRTMCAGSRHSTTFWNLKLLVCFLLQQLYGLPLLRKRPCYWGIPKCALRPFQHWLS